ncbi:unnamed protein product [Cylicostephanus goldi]|uniref:Uncharacterized protein n=1 Tax=Cylicostephanus goldi TaxID=71465 RepID=A0A3P6RSF0_CYLGO|nr:unnamed protein product [Cylicostephanus goldi]
MLTYEELHRKSEQQMAELQALQDKGMQVAVPIAFMRKLKKEQQTAEGFESDIRGGGPTRPLLNGVATPESTALSRKKSSLPVEID